MQARRETHQHLSYNLFSLTTDMNDPFSFSENPRVPEPPHWLQSKSTSQVPGVRVDLFFASAICQPLSFPVNGYSKGRLSKANVGVHSYILVLKPVQLQASICIQVLCSGSAAL